jgi:Tfp pilus assembly protein PilF
MRRLALALGLLALSTLPSLAQSKDAATQARIQVDGITNATLDRLWVEADRYWHDGDYYRIVDISRITMESDPSDDEACSIGAYLLWSLGDTKAADWLLEYGSKRAPKNRGRFYQELGWHLYNTKRHKQALPYLQKAVVAGGVPAAAYSALAHCYEKTGNLKASAQTWEDLHKRFPEFLSWKPNLARVKAKLAAQGK